MAGVAPASAAAGYDSSYFGESSFLTLAPGQSGQFAAGFTNAGSIGWQSGTSSQTNLAICLSDKATCNVPSPNAAWATSWYSSVAYATQSTTFVGPGQVGWFVYSVRAPSGATAGTLARFNGEVVLAATGERLHPEGYYQDAQVGGASGAGSQIVLQPVYQHAQVGTFPLVTATVTADPPTGSSTRTPVPNVVVVFEVSTSAPFNPSQTFTAMTNSSGQASITYTRSNPGTDAIVGYLADSPAVRATATIVWGLTAGAISVTPDDSVGRANDTCRTYSYTATNPSTGVPLNTVTLYVNFLENINRTTDQDGGATIVGDTTGSPAPTTSIPETTSVSGTGTFDVCGSNAVASVTPILFDNRGSGDPQLFETNDTADTGGTISFAARRATIAVTPIDATSRVVGDQRVYTVTATDQFGGAYTSALRLSFQETQDGNPSTASSGFITWVDNDAILATGGATGAGAPAGTTDTSDTQNYFLASLNAQGQATFGVYSTVAGSGTPMAFNDSNGNSAFDSNESAGVGGSTTWAAATLAQCTLTKSKPLAPVSAGSANTSVLGEGDVFFVFTFRDQSGNPVSPSTPLPITFQVANSGGATIAARAEGQTSDTLVGGGASAGVSTGSAIGDSDAYLVVDSAGATSATVSVSATTNGRTVSCGPVGLRWVQAQAEPTAGSLSGSIIDLDKGTSASDGGAYVLRTTGGDYVISYQPGQPLILLGASATEAQFESALSSGDVILWSYNSGAESHNITSNN